MSTPPDDHDRLRALADRFGDVYTGALTDVLHQLGAPRGALPPTIGPLRGGMRLAGPAFTVRAVRGRDAAEGVDVIEMLHTVPAGHVIVWETGADDHAVIGDLAIALLMARGCAGLVLDGGCRDVDLVVEIDLPVFCRFVTPQDMSHGLGAVAAYGDDVTIGGVTVASGDYVVGDSDGVVVVSHSLISEVLDRAEAVVARETSIRSALLRGVPWDDAYEAGVVGPP